MCIQKSNTKVTDKKDTHQEKQSKPKPSNNKSMHFESYEPFH
ncbi:MAG: hypothetical protein ACJARX_000282 [Psychroserpens sp.]|jgi:hypothetical protein